MDLLPPSATLAGRGHRNVCTAQGEVLKMKWDAVWHPDSRNKARLEYLITIVFV